MTEWREHANAPQLSIHSSRFCRPRPKTFLILKFYSSAFMRPWGHCLSMSWLLGIRGTVRAKAVGLWAQSLCWPRVLPPVRLGAHPGGGWRWLVCPGVSKAPAVPFLPLLTLENWFLCLHVVSHTHPQDRGVSILIASEPAHNCSSRGGCWMNEYAN